MQNTSSPGSTPRLRLFEPPFDRYTEQAVAQVISTGQVMQGPLVERLEAEVAKYLQVPDPERVVATSSGYSALELAMSFTPRKGYRVLVPAMTMIATLEAVVRAGLVPKLVDVGPDLQVNTDIIEAALDPQVGGVVAVDFGGRQPNMRALKDLCYDKDLMLWEDAAHAFGSRSHGELAGTLSDLACFSLHPIKPLPALGGGLLVNNIPDQPYLHVQPRRARYYGIQDREGPMYNVKHLGQNAYMTDVSAAVALQFLPRIELLNQRRRTLAGIYHEALEEAGIRDEVKPLPYDVGSTYHLFTVLCSGPLARAKLHDALEQQGIETGYHYQPLHRFTACLKYPAGDLPNADNFGSRVLQLPCHPRMSDADVVRVVEALKGALAKD